MKEEAVEEVVNSLTWVVQRVCKVCALARNDLGRCDVKDF